MIPKSLYIHIPWCIRKCPYCDFNSHQQTGTLPEKEYVAALLTDLEQDLELYPTAQLHSIFIGGGTPSLLSADAYNSLLCKIAQIVPFSKNMEITLEANPGSVEAARFQDYRALGINRLSLGVQSFFDAHLKKLGRIHDSQQAQKAIETAKHAGFDNFNIDLMYGLPNQSTSEALADIDKALKFSPKHLSWYQLTLEPNTIFYSKPPKLPNEDIIDSIEQCGLEMLSDKKFVRYEISAFSLENHESNHNVNYWLFGDYFGIGAGAHGKHTIENQILRTQKHRQPTAYLKASPNFCTQTTSLKLSDLVFEFMLNATRLERPIPYTLFEQRTGLSRDNIISKLKQASDKKLVTLTDTDWKITPFGRRFTNELQKIFLS